MKVSLIITAGGSGSRFESTQPKQFTEINNKSLLELSIEAFKSYTIQDV